MSKKTSFILDFKEIGIRDVPLVGGKNAALGEMYSNLTKFGIDVPPGFAITAASYRHFLEKAGLKGRIKKILKGLDTHNLKDLHERGSTIRKLIMSSQLPLDLRKQIGEAYQHLGATDVAVRSSATAEDLPDASFAGQQETYLNVTGVNNLLVAVKKCIASLFTDRAISYRKDKGFSHFDIALSVGVQKMVRSDLASSGVIFTLDTETGFDQVVVVTGVFGLGEMIVQGKVIPDEFIVFKPTLAQRYNAIITKNLGKKNIKLIYAHAGTKVVPVKREEEERFCLSDHEVMKLAKWSVTIEKYFSRKHQRYQPMDIEWAKDGQTGKLYIVQARPETVHAIADPRVYTEYRLRGRGKLILEGIAIGTKIAAGKVKIIKDPRYIAKFQKGEVLVTEVTDPDWEPIMKIASAIITDRGGRTSHAAIVSRELGIPCIVGTKTGTKILKNGREITIDCSSGDIGKIYEGRVKFQVIEHRLDRIPKTKTKIMVNISSPDEAFENHFLPTQGVGLGRLEFIIASEIQIHPNALLDYNKLVKTAQKSGLHRKIVSKIDALTPGFKNKTEFYVSKLAEGIARIAAAFWPHEVIMRFSDFKTNEYRKLIGGELYEPEEENPMLGFRGASRYYDPKFKRAFGLECKALRRVRQDMGFKNVVPMIPFCRTPLEGRKVLAAMKEHGLSKSSDKALKVYIMCEIPSNVILADEFLKLFDGMSIGSNDLTQLAMGIDRDSGIVTAIANENDPAVKDLISRVIEKCKKARKYIGICGQAPSDYPKFAQFLVEKGITSISLNPDTVIKTTLSIYQQEKQKKQ